MAGEITLAYRYARALLAVTLEDRSFEKVQKDLYGVADAYDGSVELRGFLGSPSFGRDEKKRALRKLFEGRVQDVTLRFLDVLVEKGRLGLIRPMAEAFDLLNDEADDVAKATVRTFLPLSDAQREALLEKLGRLTRRGRVYLEEELDPSLLGGVVVKVGDTVLDGSVQGRLRRLRDLVLVGDEEKSARASGMAQELLGG